MVNCVYLQVIYPLYCELLQISSRCRTTSYYIDLLARRIAKYLFEETTLKSLQAYSPIPYEIQLQSLEKAMQAGQETCEALNGSGKKSKIRPCNYNTEIFS